MPIENPALNDLLEASRQYRYGQLDARVYQKVIQKACQTLTSSGEEKLRSFLQQAEAEIDLILSNFNEENMVSKLKEISKVINRIEAIVAQANGSYGKVTEDICCEDMGSILADPQNNVYYNVVFKEYYIQTKKRDANMLTMDFCPWCGKAFPLSLRFKFSGIMGLE